MAGETTDERFQRIAASKRVDSEFLHASIVRHAGAAIAGEPTQVAKGESNAVFEFTLVDGRRVIARMHFQSEMSPDLKPNWFSSETAVIRCLRSAGIAVPEVIAIDSREKDEGIYSLCLQEPLPGRPLFELLLERSMSDDTTRRIMHQARELLKAIHAADASACVPLLTAPNLDIVTRILEYSASIMACDNAVASQRCKHVVAIAVERLLSEAATLHAPAHLTHGDFHPKHLMVDDGVVTGVIDFEQAELADPAKDFGWWNFWRVDPAQPSEYYPPLLTQDTVVHYGDDFPERVHVHELLEGVSTVSWYVLHNDSSAVENAARFLSGLLRP